MTTASTFVMLMASFDPALTTRTAAELALLLDYTRKLQERGMDLLEATLTAGQTRLRPVLLTAVTTILGLIPMATGVSFDFHTMHWPPAAPPASGGRGWRWP